MTSMLILFAFLVQVNQCLPPHPLSTMGSKATLLILHPVCVTSLFNLCLLEQQVMVACVQLCQIQHYQVTERDCKPVK